MTKTSFLVTCQDNPNTVFGIAESRKEAESLVNDCVDAARDVLSTAHYDHLTENGLDANTELYAEDYAAKAEVSQTSPENYLITEVAVGRPVEVNVLPSPEPDEDEDEDEDDIPDDPEDEDDENVDAAEDDEDD